VQRDRDVEIQCLIVDDIAEEEGQHNGKIATGMEKENMKHILQYPLPNPQIYRSGILFLIVKKRVVKKRPSKLMKRNVAKVIKFMEDGTSLWNNNWKNFIQIYY
jgi:hypothetical protein